MNFKTIYIRRKSNMYRNKNKTQRSISSLARSFQTVKMKTDLYGLLFQDKASNHPRAPSQAGLRKGGSRVTCTLSHMPPLASHLRKLWLPDFSLSDEIAGLPRKWKLQGIRHIFQMLPFPRALETEKGSCRFGRCGGPFPQTSVSGSGSVGPSSSQRQNPGFLLR